MATIALNFESGTDEALLTTGTSGFSASSKTNDWSRYDDAQAARGALGVRNDFVSGGSGYWMLNLAAPADRLVVGLFLKLGSNPTVQEPIAYARNASAGASILSRTTGGSLQLQNAAGTVVAASVSPALAAGTYWVTFATKLGTTTSDGTLELQITRQSDGAVVHTWSSAAQNTGTAQMTQARQGRGAAIGGAHTYGYDDFQISDQATGLLAMPSNVPVNNPPRANAGPDISVESGAAVTLNGSDSDSDGTVTGRSWKLAGTEVGTAASLSFTAPVVATDTVRTYTYTVTDNAGATTSDTVDVTIRRALIFDGAGNPYVIRTTG